MLASPTPLSDCPSRWTVDDTPGDEYHVQIDPGTHLVIEAGTFPGTPASRFTHPNIAATLQRIYEFKSAGPGRRWRSRAGVSHYFILPRDTIVLLPDRGYSYIPATVNGVKVRFNVSGGTCGPAPGWTDCLRTFTQIGVGHPLRDLRRFAAAAVRGTSLEPLPLTPLSSDRLNHWQRLAAQANPALKQHLFQLVEKGTNPMIHFLLRYSYHGVTCGPGIALVRSWRAPRHVTALILHLLGTRVRVTLHQIDWLTTAAAHGLASDSTGTMTGPTPVGVAALPAAHRIDSVPPADGALPRSRGDGQPAPIR